MSGIGCKLSRIYVALLQAIAFRAKNPWGKYLLNRSGRQRCSTVRVETPIILAIWLGARPFAIPETAANCFEVNRDTRRQGTTLVPTL